MDKKPYANNTTLSMPANQMRVLKNQVSMLGRAIGNIFLPIVAKVLPYLNQLVYALRELAEWIVHLLGFEDFDWGNATGADNSAIGYLLDDTEGVSDNLDKAADNAKKFKNQLQGFDKLNNLTTSDDSDTDKGGAGAGGIDTGLLDAALDDALSRYQKRWDEAFNNMNQSFSDFADNAKKAFEEGGLYGVGAYFAETITKGLNSIPWDTVKTKAGQAGKAIADFLNGLTNPALFSAAGAAFSQGINTVFSFLDSFVKEYDFNKLGTSIASGLNAANEKIDWKTIFDFAGNLGTKLAGFVNGIVEDTNWELAGTTVTNAVETIRLALDNFSTKVKWGKIGKSAATFVNKIISYDWGKVGSTIAKFFSGVTTTVLNFVQNVDWDGLGTSIGNFVNGLLKYDWKSLGKTISTSIRGILKTITSALKTVKWKKVGKSIAQFIGSIDWGDITWDLLELAESLLKALADVIKGLWEDSNIVGKIAIAIATVIGAIKFTGTSKTLLGGAGENIATGMFGGKFKRKAKSLIGTAVASYTFSELGLGITDVLDKAFGKNDKTPTTNFFDEHKKAGAAVDVLGLLGPYGSAGRTFARSIGKQEVLNSDEPNYEKVKNKVVKDLGLSDGSVFYEAISKLKLEDKLDKIAKKYSYNNKDKHNINDDKGIESLENKISEWIKSQPTSDSLIKAGVKQGTDNLLSGVSSVTTKFYATEDKSFIDAKASASKQDYSAKTTVSAEADENSKKLFDGFTAGFKTNLEVLAKKNMKDNGSKTLFNGMDNGYNTYLNFLAKQGTDKSSEKLFTKINDGYSTWLAFKAKKNTDNEGSKKLFSGITDGFKADISMLAKKNMSNTTSKNNFNLIANGASTTLTLNAKWKAGSLTGLSAELEKSITKNATNASDYYSVINRPRKKADGGIWTGSIWKSITGAKRYASGGLPNIGTLFWAGEGGAEIVGNTTRGTEVLNQSQIAQAMAESMESANVQQNAIMRQQNQLLREEINVLHAILEKTGITEGEVFSAVRNADANYARVNGHSAFA